MAKQILIVDDDSLMRRSLSIRLEDAGYVPCEAATGEDALDLVRTSSPDLVLLDIGLPGMDGLETLRAIQRELGEVPVIFVTAHRRELDEIVGLELGADDYITKPFDMDVLLAHIKAVLRRTNALSDSMLSNGKPGQPADETLVVTVGDIRIDRAAHTVHVGEQLVELTLKEYELLLALARSPGQVLSADELLNQVWGAEWVGESQTIYVHVHWLREKVEEDPDHPRRLLTVRGVGYKLVTPT